MKDKLLFESVERELNRQRSNIELIASENFVSEEVLELAGSVLTNKYAEGYPAKRYYGGCQFVDEVEELARKRICEIYGAEHANVQPHSGAQANTAVYLALLQHGDKVLGMSLADGGHLTHGHPLNFSGINYEFYSYGVSKETETIDYEEYNPQTDPYISVNYSKKDAVSGKKENKVALQKELGLPVREDAFLIGIVSRMTSQKGFDLIGCVLDELLTEMDIQLVVLGSGESQYENMLHHYQSKYPDKVSVHIGFTEERSHHIYAASDVLLMPSMFEPCGLAQMIAMRYGTLPIVRETGGLRDTVEPYNEYENTGCGFSFANFNAQEMADIVRYAYRVEHEQKAAWKELIYRAMDRNFSWNASAHAYEKLYDKLVEM